VPIFVDVDAATLNLMRSASRIACAVFLAKRCGRFFRSIFTGNARTWMVSQRCAGIWRGDCRGCRAGSWCGVVEPAGRIACVAAAFSFYPTKNLSAYGDAGMSLLCVPRWRSTYVGCGITAVHGAIIRRVWMEWTAGCDPGGGTEGQAHSSGGVERETPSARGYL